MTINLTILVYRKSPSTNTDIYGKGSPANDVCCIDIRPAKRTYTYHKDGRVCKFHIGDLIRYEKKNKIKGNTKLDTFVCAGVRFDKDDSYLTK